MPKTPKSSRQTPSRVFAIKAPGGRKLAAVRQDGQIFRLIACEPFEKTSAAERGMAAHWLRQFFPGMTWDQCYTVLYALPAASGELLANGDIVPASTKGES